MAKNLRKDDRTVLYRVEVERRNPINICAESTEQTEDKIAFVKSR